MKSVGNWVGNVDINEERRINRQYRGVGGYSVPNRFPPKFNNAGSAPNSNSVGPAPGSPPVVPPVGRGSAALVPGFMRKTVSAMTNANKRSINVLRDSQPVWCPCLEPFSC